MKNYSKLSLLIVLSLSLPLLSPNTSFSKRLTAKEKNILSHPIFKAMDSEMKRSMKKIKFEDYRAPYFLAYQILDFSEIKFSARNGTRIKDSRYKNRYLYVELRYGNYSLDNTDENYRGFFDTVSLEGSVKDMTHRIWLLTDKAYKQAIKSYLQKRGKKLSEIQKEKLSDFSREKPVTTVILPPTATINVDLYKKAMEIASEKFSQHIEIIDSGITLRVSHKNLYYLNSEGSKIFMPKGENPYYIYLWARTQSEDGMNLSVSRTFSAKTLDLLPNQKKLIATAEEISEQLLNLREAETTDPYTGPALLDPESTGVLFHEAVGHRLEGERQRDEDEGHTFKGQVGKKIIPSFLTVIDNPTQQSFNDQSLNGHYSYDDEGIPAKKVVMVDHGILKGYLMSRRPITGVNKSNGHGRAQFGRDPIGRMSNLMIESSKEYPVSTLKKMLMEESKKQNKPYGLLIRRTRSGDTYTGRGRYQAFRGTPEEVYLVDSKTGAETLVRGVEIVGTPLITINKIIATGKEKKVLNAFCGAESGMVPVSTVAPWSLVKEMEMQKVREDKQRPPILISPLFDTK